MPFFPNGALDVNRLPGCRDTVPKQTSLALAVFFLDRSFSYTSWKLKDYGWRWSDKMS
jgi:hypothetical protein